MHKISAPKIIGLYFQFTWPTVIKFCQIFHFISKAGLLSNCKWKSWRIFCGPTVSKHKKINYWDILIFICWYMKILKSLFNRKLFKKSALPQVNTTNPFHRLSSKAISSSFHFCLVCSVNQSVILLQWTTQNRASMINLSVRLSSLVCHCPSLCSESRIISITHGQDYVESSEIRQIKYLSSEFWLKLKLRR